VDYRVIFGTTEDRSTRDCYKQVGW